MKAKILLTSMVLPALFAACTSDEIVENNGGSISGRKTFEPVGITLAENAETRFSWDASKGQWNAFTAEDKFSAGLVDGVTQWTVGNKVATNFVYSSTDGKNFTTPSKMMEGVYFFYSYPGFENLSSRSEVPFDLNATQTKIDLADPSANVNATQLFISPLYKVEADYADAKLPLQFRSYWSTVGIPVKNTSGQDFKIVRIVLENAGGFEVKGTLNLTLLGKSAEEYGDMRGLVYSYDATSGTYVLPMKDEETRESLDDLWVKDIADAADDGNQTAIMVEVENGTVADGKEAVAYLQVPAGRFADDITAKIYVEVTEETGKVVKELSKTLVKGYTEEDVNYVRFRRGYATAAFGQTNGVLNAYVVDKVELMTAGASTAQYAATYEDFAKIATSVAAGDEAEIYNVGSLKVDDQVLSLMKRLYSANGGSNRSVKFMNAITMTSDASSVNSLKNIFFNDKVIVEKGSYSLDTRDILLGEDAETHPVASEMVVNKGVKVVVNKAQTGRITSEGEVTVKANTTVDHVAKNSATLNIEYTTALGADLKLGVTAMPKYININGKNGGNITVTGPADALNVPSVLKVNQYATLTTGTGALTLKGNVENKGTIGQGTGVVNMYGENENNKITIENYGTINTATLNQFATIKQMSALATVNSITNGYVDNTIGGFVTGTNSAGIYAAYTGNQQGTLGNVQGCNMVIVEDGAWTDPSVESNVKTLSLDGVTLNSRVAGTGITFATVESAEMKECTVAENLTLTTATSIDVTGTTFEKEFTAGKVTRSTLDDATFNGTVSLGAAAMTAIDLTGVTINATFNAANVTNIVIGKDQSTVAANKVVYKTTTVAGTVTIKTAAASTMTINKYATLEVKPNGKIGTSNSENGTVITNNGTVLNYGKVGSTVVDTVESTEDAVWTGAATVNS